MKMVWDRQAALERSTAGAAWCSQTERYFGAMVGFTQPFFITPCDGRKLR